METTKKPDQLLTKAQAAMLSGMSRPAFLKHIGKDIEPDAKIGERSFFLMSTVLAFRRARAKNGTKKRGPKPRAK